MRVYVAGHRGMVGSAICRQLEAQNVEVITRPRDQLNLLDINSVRAFMNDERPDAVVLAAAKVGGILANDTYPAEFIYENLTIQCNVIHQAFLAGIERLLFLGSSCIYPKHASQPIKEDALLSGSLEGTNEPYAIAKIAGIKMCESYNRQYGTDYRSVMPTNLYGPGDNFHPLNSHVIPALMRKFHDAVENNADAVTIWGTGNPRREFLHVDDMASASIFVLNADRSIYLMNTDVRQSHINVGFGSDITIRNLAELLAKVTEFRGAILFDPDKPDGTMKKLMDSERLAKMGWRPSIHLEDGIKQTYDWFKNNIAEVRV